MNYPISERFRLTWRTRGNPVSVFLIKNCGTHLPYSSLFPLSLLSRFFLSRGSHYAHGEDGAGTGGRRRQRQRARRRELGRGAGTWGRLPCRHKTRRHRSDSRWTGPCRASPPPRIGTREVAMPRLTTWSVAPAGAARLRAAPEGHPLCSPLEDRLRAWGTPPAPPLRPDVLPLC